MKAALYARVSTVDKDQNPEVQLSTSPFEFLIGVTSGITYLALPSLFLITFAPGPLFTKDLVCKRLSSALFC
ncbi:hypothetical protein ES703_112807 [subsurface metagenome]